MKAPEATAPSSFPEMGYLCDRCSQICFRPVTVRFLIDGPVGVTRTICNECFRAAVQRSGARVTEDTATIGHPGSLSVVFPDQTRVPIE